ncbi:MAG: acyl-CoA dehydrogenase family protein [Burkholderiales bacterium]
MDFDVSEEQQQLADSLTKFLANEYDFEARKAAIGSAAGVGEKTWATFAELGVTAIPFAEADGGFGGGAVDLMAAMEACGEALVVEPLIDTLGLAGRLVARAGSDAQKAAVLPGVIDGSTIMSFGYLERGRRYASAPKAVSATRDGAGWKLDGEKVVVIGAPLARTLVVSAATGKGASLFLVDRNAPGVSVNAYRNVDGTRAGDIKLSGVKLGPEALLGTEGGAQDAIDEALDFATALLCADAVGAMKYACDATLEYLKTRKQFGMPIGAFQVLQHRMVDMVISCEQARSMAVLAACRVDQATDPKERMRAASMAKVRIADAVRHVSQESVQLHGGMGMTEEMKVSHTFRRLTNIAQRFGDADHHLARLAALG